MAPKEGDTEDGVCNHASQCRCSGPATTLRSLPVFLFALCPRGTQGHWSLVGEDVLYEAYHGELGVMEKELEASS